MELCGGALVQESHTNGECVYSSVGLSSLSGAIDENRWKNVGIIRRELIQSLVIRMVHLQI